MKLERQPTHRTLKAVEALMAPEIPRDVIDLEQALTPQHLRTVEAEINRLADLIRDRIVPGIPSTESSEVFVKRQARDLVYLLYGLRLTEQVVDHQLIDPKVRQWAKMYLYKAVPDDWGLRIDDWIKDSGNGSTFRLSQICKLLQFFPEARKNMERDPKVFDALRKKTLQQSDPLFSLATAESTLIVWPERREEIQGWITEQAKRHVRGLVSVSPQSLGEISYLGFFAKALLVHPEWRTELGLEELDWRALNIFPKEVDHAISTMQMAAGVAIVTAGEAQIDDTGVIRLTRRVAPIGTAQPLPARLQM